MTPGLTDSVGRPEMDMPARLRTPTILKTPTKPTSTAVESTRQGVMLDRDVYTTAIVWKISAMQESAFTPRSPTLDAKT